MSVPVTSLHGHLYYAIKNACKCQDCLWARKQDKRNNIALHHTIRDFTKYGHILRDETPVRPPKGYSDHMRDPRRVPKPGDVFEKDGRIRSVTQIVLRASGLFCILFKDSGSFIPTRNEKCVGRADQLPLPMWRKWAATANILEVAQ